MLRIPSRLRRIFRRSRRSDEIRFFEYSSINRAAAERAARKHVKKVEIDGSERSRLRNLGWFCLILPAIGAGLGWLLGW